MKRERDNYDTKTLKRLTKNSVVGGFSKNPELIEKCRIWTGLQENGRGIISYHSKPKLVHRVSLKIEMGLESLPKFNEKGEMLEVRHLCNKPLCIEPTHLKLGTKIENAEDKILNESSKGENHPRAKITEDIARQIKLSKPLIKDKNNETQLERSNRFGVPKSTIRAIDCGVAWSYLPFSNGLTSEDKALSVKIAGTKRRIVHKNELNNATWSVEQWEDVRKKLLDPKYVKLHEKLLYNNISCKEWMGSSINGYGQISIHGITMGAHIAACMINNNFVRPDNLEVRHRCGNSLCVEPLHLEFGTRVENMEDKIDHGTNGIIPFDIVLKIRSEFETGEITKAELGRKYNISKSHATTIINKKIRIKG